MDWDVLLFFAALFVMVESMGEVGLIRGIGDVLTTLIEAIPADSRVIASTTILIWCSAIIRFATIPLHQRAPLAYSFWGSYSS